MSALQIVTKASDLVSLTLALDGRLDAQTTPELDAYVSSHLDPDIAMLILDLEKLTFISSAGLRVLARTRKELQNRGGKVLMLNPTPQVKKVFEVVKAVPPAEVFRNEEELDWYLATIQEKVASEA